MGKNFEVLHINVCWDNVTMAIIYVVMFGKTVYEHSRCGKYMCTCMR